MDGSRLTGGEEYGNQSDRADRRDGRLALRDDAAPGPDAVRGQSDPGQCIRCV